MKISLNPPLAHLQLANYGEVFFAIAYYVTKYPDYAMFYKKQSSKGNFIIIDNGAYEKMTLDSDELIKAAKEIGAKEIIAPDVIRRPILTYKQTQSFLSGLSQDEKRQFSIMAVPQSESKRYWIREYVKMVELEINTIGLPKWLVRRDVIVKKLLRLHHFDWTKNHHLLGINNVIELYQMPKGVIRSIDTKLPIFLGANLLPITAQKRDNTRYFSQCLNDTQLRHALKNIVTFKEICANL